MAKPIRWDRIYQWTPEQCQRCMTRLNGESVRLDAIAADLSFYREHCNFIVANAITRNVDRLWNRDMGSED